MTAASSQAGPNFQQQNRTLRRLLEVSLVLNSNFELEPLLNYIMEAASEITLSESASILLIDPRTNELYFVASNTENASRMMRIPVPIDSSIAGAVVRENRPIILPDASQDPRHNRDVDKQTSFQTRSLMGVPMRIKDEVIGVLEVVNRKGAPWTDDDRDHLFILASQAAVAINNAQQAEDLRTAKEELEQVDKLKNDFIAIASHELRTPLSVIVGYASFLQEEAQGEASEHAARVLNSAQHLVDLIEDMTNLRYLQIGDSELNLEETPLVTLLHTAQREGESMAGAKAQHLEFHYPGLSDTVSVDAAKFSLALTNLINNAIKFTPQNGQIWLHTEHHSSEVWIRIKDTGIGIAPDQLGKIFKNFYQASDHMTRRFNGMGMGLAIAKAVVEAHHGRIWAELEGRDKGATFTIALPLVASKN